LITGPCFAAEPPLRSTTLMPVILMLSPRLRGLCTSRGSIASLRLRSLTLILDFQPLLCNLMISVCEFGSQRIIAATMPEVANRALCARSPAVVPLRSVILSAQNS
jgi:hypothetical protein